MIDENSIIRSILDPVIELDEMSYDDIDDGTEDGIMEKSIKTQKAAGDLYPLLSINDYTIHPNHIEYFKIDATSFIPTVIATISFGSNSTFISRALPKDGDLLNVFIRSRNDAFKPIRNDYLITSVNTSDSINSQGEGMSITILGKLFIPRINDEVMISKRGTSFNALLDIASNLGLGFATNEVDTDDSQVWICPNDTYDNFIKHISSSAWKDSNSFFKVFIDVYYHLNFINVNNQFTESTKIDEALADLLISSDSMGDDEIEMGETKKVFSNVDEFRNTNMYIQSYGINNNSSEISNTLGYKMHCEFFEHNTTEKWDIYVEPILDGDATDKILLRGRPGEDYYKTQIKRKWAGLQYSLPEHNVHEKYLYARVHNLMNLAELEKLQVRIEVPRANFNIYKCERIPCVFISSGDPMKSDLLNVGVAKEEMSESPLTNSVGGARLDTFYSGFYMIHGMEFIYKDTGRGKGHEFSENVILTRREWPAPV